MADIYIPTLHTFAMENPFTGSCGLFRLKITPNVVKATPNEVDFAQSTIQAEYWHGLFCYEKSEIEATEVFPMTEEGRAEMKAWLEKHV